MNWIKLLFSCLLCIYVLTTSSCAPVKFSKADNFTVKPNCTGATCNTSSVQCDPKINGTLTTFTYAAALPSITSSCTPSDVDYVWTVKRADTSVISTTIPGLSGANPQSVDFRGLGAGVYYVYLTANQTGGSLSPYAATTPLEFIVPGSGVGNSLTCDPKLNSTFTSVVVNASDSNAVVSANCTPAAGTYIWSVTKNGVATTIAGLSGATSTPDLKSYGAGTYKISLYAASPNSQHWQSTTPLTVTIASVPTPTTPIECSPRINGSLTTLTLTSSSPNPLISANCLPSAVQYTWSVTRNGSSVSVPALSGASSNPNFLSLGQGTYLIYLTASASGYANWSTTTPLTITVDNSGVGTALNCSPRLNNTSTALTITTAGPNPLVTSGCNPSSAAHTWTVTKNGTAVSVSGLSGPSSTPNFISLGQGTYLIYLAATASGYNSYASPSPLELTIAASPSTVRRVNYSRLVQASDNKVDILMVFDDSNSMAPENTRLATRLQGFVNDLTSSGIDWQMCATVTRAQDVSNNGILYWGASRNWVNYVGSPQWILKTGATDPYSIFTNTVAAIGAGWAGTDDERGIKAAWSHADYKSYNSCYRDEASLAVVLISDEDERSVGGDATQVYYPGELKTLEADDLPQGYVNKIKQVFGTSKRFTFNSIIVKPGDASCMASQDSEGAKSHYGYKYSELSQLTGGATGSICATDYSSNLYYFKDRIVNSLASIPLECTPVGDIDVTITPTIGSVSVTLQNNTLVFSPAIPAGRTIQLGYDCPRN